MENNISQKHIKMENKKAVKLTDFQKNEENPFMKQAIEGIENHVVKKYKSNSGGDKRAVVALADTETGEVFKFSTLKEDDGMAFYPVSGAVIAQEKKSVTGKVNQLCNYPFYIVYRTSRDSPNMKADIKEFLDSVGKWLERQTVVIDGEKHKLTSYPTLTDERKIEEITRITPSYLDKTYENNVQDWVISMSLKYRNVFIRTN